MSSEDIDATRQRVEQAQREWQAAQEERDRLLMELVGDSEFVPVDVAERLGLDLRTAASIVRRHRARKR